MEPLSRKKIGRSGDPGIQKDHDLFGRAGHCLWDLQPFFFHFPVLEKEVLPKVDQGQFILKVEMQLGTRLEVTDRVCKRFEEHLRSMPEVEGVAVTIGSEKGAKGQQGRASPEGRRGGRNRRRWGRDAVVF